MLITKNVSHNVVRPEWAVILRLFITARLTNLLNYCIMYLYYDKKGDKND